MTADSSWPLQESVDTALRADATLIALLAGGADGIYDGVPQDSSFPYVVLGSMTGRDFSTKTVSGQDNTITIDVWSQFFGKKEGLQILSAIRDVLDTASLAVSGQSLVLLRYEFQTDFLDPDGLTRHFVTRYRAVTQEA